MDERDKMQVTGDMQNQELQRFQSQSELGRTQSVGGDAIPASKFHEMKERVDNIAISFVQKEHEYQRQIDELKTREHYLLEEKKSLTIELDQLKETKESLFKQIQSLELQITIFKSQNQPGSHLEELKLEDKELVLQERLLKAENALDHQRLENQRLLREGQELQSQRNALQFRLLSVQDQLERLQQAQTGQEFADRQMIEEINEQNMELQERARLLREEVEKARAEKPPALMMPN